MSEENKIQKLGNWLKSHLDAVILSVNTLIMLFIGIAAIWALGVSLQVTIYDMLNAIDLILVLILVNIISILLLTGRKRSAMFPLLTIIVQCFIFLILMFINLLFAGLLGLNILAAIFCVKKRPILPRFRTKNGFYSLLILVLLIISPIIFFFGTSAFTITLPARTNPNFKVSFYAEFYNNDTFTTTHLDALNNHSSRIFLAINESQIYNYSLAFNITQRLNNANVSVYAWLLLDIAKGYWAADSNVMEFASLVDNFTAWAKANGLIYEGIMVDSEPDFQRMETLQSQIGSLNIFGALLNLRQAATSGEHEFAKEKYEELADTIQESGYEAMVVGFPMPVDDLADGDDTLQRLMGVSTMPPHNWNYSSFMIYRTTYKEMLTMEFGSYFVYSYAKTIWNYFGKSSSVSLARCGSDPYDTIEECIKDVLIIKNIGFDEVIWISLERLDRAFGVAGLIQLLEAAEGTQSVSFNYNPWCGLVRLLLIAVDQIEII